MGELHSISETNQAMEGRPTDGQHEVLERAVAKLVLIGEQVGVSASEMISLLESGLTVVDLLEYLVLRQDEVG